MKHRFSNILLVLNLISLLTLGAIFFGGIVKNKLTGKDKLEINQSILGEKSEVIDTFVKNTLKDTKEAVSEKATEVEKTILETVKKEAETLTKSQVDALKLKICQDLGVITPEPTKQP